MSDRVTPLAKKIFDLINAEKVPIDLAFAALSLAAINMCLKVGKTVQWYCDETLGLYEDVMQQAAAKKPGDA